MRPLTLLLMKSSILVGGQAVIEGVMIRVPGSYATAVRDPEGRIRVQQQDFRSLADRRPVWKRPLLRGMLSLYEALRIGFRTLEWSAEIALPPPEQPAARRGKWSNFVSITLAVLLAVLLFMVAPLWITTYVLAVERDALVFNLVAGLFRISFFVLYIVAISFLKDVRRLFRYHGAEHRVVYNFESGNEITIPRAQSFPTRHPRCGTSFLFIVLIAAILVFSLLDTLILAGAGRINLGIRLLTHLPLVPLVAGVGYELIKLSAGHPGHSLWRFLSAPGMWLQKITTQAPSDDMVEVAITALKTAFGDRYQNMLGREYVAEAVA